MEKLKLSPSQPPVSSNKGFSLVEVLIALSILGIAFLSIIQLVTLGLRVVQTNETNTRNLFLAQELMEETIAKDFDQIVTNGTVIVTTIATNLKEIEVMGLLKTTIAK
jgi:prepilin-type N-terminal cleavage/methylation domain-containing protein